MKMLMLVLCAFALSANAEISIDSFMGYKLGAIHEFNRDPDTNVCRRQVFSTQYTTQIAPGESVRVETDATCTVLVVAHCYRFDISDDDNAVSFALDSVNELETKYGIKMNKSQYTRLDHMWSYGDAAYNLDVHCVFEDDFIEVEIVVYKKQHRNRRGSQSSSANNAGNTSAVPSRVAPNNQSIRRGLSANSEIVCTTNDVAQATRFDK